MNLIPLAKRCVNTDAVSNCNTSSHSRIVLIVWFALVCVHCFSVCGGGTTKRKSGYVPTNRKHVDGCNVCRWHTYNHRYNPWMKKSYISRVKNPRQHKYNQRDWLRLSHSLRLQRIAQKKCTARCRRAAFLCLWLKRMEYISLWFVASACRSKVSWGMGKRALDGRRGSPFSSTTWCFFSDRALPARLQNTTEKRKKSVYVHNKH